MLVTLLEQIQHKQYEQNIISDKLAQKFHLSVKFTLRLYQDLTYIYVSNLIKL